jgi:hypothetical protein
VYETKKKPRVTAGHYHNLWDTQMGEETVSLQLDEASTEEVEERVKALLREVDKLTTDLKAWKGKAQSS